VLKAALAAERAQKHRNSQSRLSCRSLASKASEDMALIAQQKLWIAELERQVYGQRSERWRG
jgi:transposase